MEEKQQITEIITEVFQLIGFSVSPKMREVIGEDGHPECTFIIKTDEHAQCFIGHHGANLRSIEHLTHVIARQKGIKMRFMIDVNDYKEGKRRMFERIAKDTAKKVIQTKKPVMLGVMTAYERRLVHTTLVNDDNVKTESVGNGTERKIVISPVGIIDVV